MRHKCTKCGHVDEFPSPIHQEAGRKSKRKITPEQQAKMQLARMYRMAEARERRQAEKD